MVRRSALKARNKLKILIEEINGAASDIEGYVESSGDEYDIRKDGSDGEQSAD